MRRLLFPIIVAAAFGLAGCGEEGSAALPEPFALTQDAMGRYCGMNVLEHPGPKGQVIFGPEPIWFSSARDAVAFTMLPEEPKTYSAIYVSDMEHAPDWDNPGADNWVDARAAFYVIGSSARGGMGAAETVPFSTRDAAERFAQDNGGEVVTFEDIPVDYVLGPGDAATAPGAVGSTQ